MEDQITRRRLLTCAAATLGTAAAGTSAFAQQQSAEDQTLAGHAFGNELLKDRVAVITGAARGISRAIAVEMAANGAEIVGIDICARVTPVQTYPVSTRADLDETAATVQQHGRKFMALVDDVRDILFLHSAADYVEQWFLDAGKARI
ncbi:hypothetical protein JAO29_07535 [Edaphobacter sp. HDX4]|uniref:hypothetical protein n=1 Tax=Edaphobacter sp. HDX4 TaxID=2794064 RepID=UPI002FE681CB